MADTGVYLNTLDPRSLADLKRLASTKDASDETLRGVSKQVESMFLQMMLKAMRDASPATGPFESEQTRLARGLYDQQLASDLAQAKGIGLADILFRQLGGGKGIDLKPETTGADATTESAATTVEKASATVAAARKAGGNVPQHVREFVDAVWPHAQAASQATGIPAHFMVAQAALETGWGAKQVKNADGSPSYNLFNIKAGRGWDGATTADRTVAEYGSAGWQRQKAAFRSYDSYAEAFEDYANLLKSNSRYAGVLGADDAASFAQGLQKAGYATDPMYANKLMRIIAGGTLRNALAATA